MRDSDRHPVPPDPALARVLSHPQITERYEIIQELGRGGMGALFVARDRALDRPVALKLVLVSDPESVARFLREGRILAQINHPRILKVYSAEVVGETPVLVLELLKGTTLDTHLQGVGAYDVPAALAIVGMVLEGLEAAHEAGIIHRDLKPENILLLDDGGLKILDFGIAREVTTGKTRAQGGLTRAGVIVGTPAYMSPEQCRAMPMDARSDLYSVGVILFELLTGRLPFTGATPLDLLMAHVKEEPPDPARLVPGVPGRVARAVTRLLSKRPEDRYPDARALSVALGAMRVHLPETTSSRGEHVSANAVQPTARLAVPRVTGRIEAVRPTPLQATAVARAAGDASATPHIRRRRALALGLSIVGVGLTVALLGRQPPAPTGESARPAIRPAQSAAAPLSPSGSITLPTIRNVACAADWARVELSGPAPAGTRLTVRSLKDGKEQSWPFGAGTDRLRIGGLLASTAYRAGLEPGGDTRPVGFATLARGDGITGLRLARRLEGFGGFNLTMSSSGDRVALAWLQASSRGEALYELHLRLSEDAGESWSADEVVAEVRDQGISSVAADSFVAVAGHPAIHSSTCGGESLTLWRRRWDRPFDSLTKWVLPCGRDTAGLLPAGGEDVLVLYWADDEIRSALTGPGGTVVRAPSAPLRLDRHYNLCHLTTIRMGELQGVLARATVYSETPQDMLLFARRASSMGSAWSRPRRISRPNEEVHRSAVASTNDLVFIAFNDGVQNRGLVSRDGGDDFLPVAMPSLNSGIDQNSPALAAVGGSVFLAYVESEVLPPRSELVVARYADPWEDLGRVPVPCQISGGSANVRLTACGDRLLVAAGNELCGLLVTAVPLAGRAGGRRPGAR